MHFSKCVNLILLEMWFQRQGLFYARRTRLGRDELWEEPMTDQTPILRDYELSDRYTRTEGRVFLTGTQAILRIALDQARRDKAAGLDTRGFISGYRGSPVGGIDLEVSRNRALVEAEGIGFVPAVNEELAATQIIGTQQVETDPDRTCAGVFGLWYGKGPGVDRAADALKHGNAYGSSPHGGVLVVAGDDHGCVSSSMPHQSDVAFMNFFMPTINPANVAEFLSFAEWGYALSRFSGMWVGFKAISETVESGMSFELPKPRSFAAPDYEPPKSGLHYRWPDLPGPQIEERMEAKKAAVLAFARANPIDRSAWGHDAHFGIVTTGKSHLDVLEALRLLGIDEARAAEIGLDIYKVGMVWPLEHEGALAPGDGQRALVLQPPSLLVALAHHALRLLAGEVVEILLELAFDDAPLLFYDQQFALAPGEGQRALVLQRPDHADLVDVEADLGGARLVDAQ